MAVHLDGKLFPDITGKTVDRLPVIVSGDGMEKLLRVPDLSSGTGVAHSHAVISQISDWNLVE